MIRKDKEKIMIRQDKNIIVWQRVKSLKKKIIQERNKKRKGEKNRKERRNKSSQKCDGNIKVLCEPRFMEHSPPQSINLYA